jgi:hypothetical protein
MKQNKTKQKKQKKNKTKQKTKQNKKDKNKSKHNNKKHKKETNQTYLAHPELSRLRDCSCQELFKFAWSGDGSPSERLGEAREQLINVLVGVAHREKGQGH